MSITRDERVEAIGPLIPFVWLPHCKQWLNLNHVIAIGERWMQTASGIDSLHKDDYDIVCALLVRLTNPPLIYRKVEP